ncbi:hypothetical protein KAR63_07765, partial [Weissella uvarum]|nr:hypothetical protein [Weissella uvarum]
MVKKKRVLGSNSLNVKKYFDNATPKQKFAALGGGATLLTGVGLYQANATEKEQSNKNSDASKASSKVTDEYDLNGKPKKKNDLERLINGNTKDKDKTLSRLTGDNSSESTLSDLLGSNDKDMDTSKDADNVLAKLKDEETSKGNTNGSETRLSGQSTGMPSVNMDSGKTRGNNVTIKPIVNKENSRPKVKTGGSNENKTVTPLVKPDNNVNQNKGDNTVPSVPNGGNQGGGTTTPPTIPDNGGNQGGGTTTPPTTPDKGGNQGGGTTTPPTIPDNGGNQGGGTTTPPTTPDNGGNQGGGTTTPPTTPDNGGNQGGGTTTPPTTP